MMDSRLDAIRRKYAGHPEFLGIEILDVNQPGAVDDTLLHLAARTGQLEEVEALLACGADPNRAGDLGNTPLHQAAMKGQSEVVRRLLKAGADPKLVNEFDQTAEDVARLGRHFGVAALLQPRPRG